MNNNCVCGVPAERCTLIIADKGFLYNTERKRKIYLSGNVSVCLNSFT